MDFKYSETYKALQQTSPPADYTPRDINPVFRWVYDSRSDMKDLQSIEGFMIPKLEFYAQKIGDLIYHEGPLLSLFLDRDNPDTYYIYKWVDCNQKYNRWLISTTNITNLRSFFSKEFSLKELFLKNPVCFLIEIDHQLNTANSRVCSIHALPDGYFPGEKSFFNEERYTEFASTYKQIILRSPIHNTLQQLVNEVDDLKLEQQKMMTIISSFLQSPKRHRKKAVKSRKIITQQ